MKRIFIILICMSMALSMALLASCSGAPADPAYQAAAPPPSEDVSPSRARPDAAPEAGSGGFRNEAPAHAPAPAPDMAFEANESIGELPILTPSEAGDRVLTYTVNLRLQTTNFIPGIRMLLNAASERGGHLESASIWGRDMRDSESERSASFLLRIPSERLTEFIIVVEDNYNIFNLEQNMDERTAEYRQVGINLDFLRLEESRLLEELENEDLTDQERRNLERELLDIRSWMSDVASQQAAIEHAVNFSTVTVHLSEVIFAEAEDEDEEEEEPEPAANFGDRLADRIESSINMFIVFCQGFLLVIIAIVPVLLILAILAVLALLIIMLIRGAKPRIRKMVKSKSAQIVVEPGRIVEKSDSDIDKE